MTRRILPSLLCVSLTLGVVAAAIPAAAVPGPAETAPVDESATGAAVVVIYDEQAGTADRRAARAAVGAELVKTLGAPEFQLVEPTGDATAEETAEALSEQPGVLAAVPDVVFDTQSVPDDPLLPDLWGLRNTGQVVNGLSGSPDSDIDADLAWDRAVGSSSVVVADLDSGYFFEHPDLAPVAWRNADDVAGNGLDDDGNGYVDDIRGWDAVDGDSDPTDPGFIVVDGQSIYADDSHGVHTAGTIAARGNDGVGTTGVAQNARIMPIRVCRSLDFGCPLSAIVEGIHYAAANGARVANLSITAHLGPETASAALPIALAFAANPEVLFVVAAGNNLLDADDPEPGAIVPYPCAIDPTESDPVIGYTAQPGAVDNVVCVAATDQDDNLAWFTNTGAHSVDLAAPGTSILSTAYVTTTVYEPNFRDGGFAGWTTPTPPASGAGQGFAMYEQSGVQLPGARSDRPSAAGPPTHLPGTTRATQSPAIDVPARMRSCTVDLSTFGTGLGADEQFGMSVLVDGQVVSDQTASPVPQSKDWSSPTVVLPDDGAPHRLSVQARYTRGTQLAATTLSAVLIDDVQVRCREASHRFSDGTSMAAPHVSGTAALLFSLDKTASVSEVKKALLSGTDRIPGLEDRLVTGGRLNAFRALGALVPIDTRIRRVSTGLPHAKNATLFVFDTRKTARGASFECRLDDGAFHPCGRTKLYLNLPKGTHTLAVRTVLPGGVDRTPAVSKWKVTTGK